MTFRPLIVVASVVLAIVAGVWAGDATSPSPDRSAAPALHALDVARVKARAQLYSATTIDGQHAAARELARVHRGAARTLPAQRAALETAARAYDRLAQAPPAAFAAAAARTDRAEAALAADLRRPAPDRDGPAVPPALPLLLLGVVAAIVAVATRRRTPPPRPPPATEPDAPPPQPRRLAWDTPPPGI